LTERLPENPLVVVPVEEIGRYGGTLRRALTGDIVQTAGVNKTLAENLMGYERPLPNRIEHNLAEKHWFEDNGRVAYFKLRKGVRWPDGHLFTVDDILFWYYDVRVDDNARSSAALGSVWGVDGEPIGME
jgi:peptide/nickel transport system substrate-binding protein